MEEEKKTEEKADQESVVEEKPAEQAETSVGDTPKTLGADTPAVAPTLVSKPKGKKRKVIRQVAHGRAYIQATYNNTIVTLTDLNGNVLASSSAGQNGFRGAKKATPYAAGVIVRNAVEKVQKYGLKDVNVFVKGVGQGRDSAVRALNANSINVISIKDVTPIPHNGPRQRKPRRV